MMLSKFSVENYRGFADKIEWNLSKPNNYEFNNYAIKNGVIKNGIIYGPNGSGKTNFSLALFDIVNHLTQKMKKDNYYTNYISAFNLNNYVKFLYEFQFDNSFLVYEYSKDGSGILAEEKLSFNGELIFNRSFEDFYMNSTYFQMNEPVKISILNSANNISIINYILASYPVDKDHFLMKLKEFVDSMLWFRCLDTREFIGLDSDISSVGEFIIKNNLLEDFAEFLKSVSGQSFDFTPTDVNDKFISCKIGGNDVRFLSIASTGTFSLEILYYWVKRLSDASFVFIDEFDAFYHFRLAFNVCKLLFNLDCQVFTSSHNTYLMTNDLLRPDCNFIINNNVIKSLKDSTDKELRFAHNMEKLYRGNMFEI